MMYLLFSFFAFFICTILIILVILLLATVRYIHGGRITEIHRDSDGRIQSIFERVI